MTMNEGVLDRVIRLSLGLALATIAVLMRNAVLAIVALLPIATGLVGFCPLYRLAGVSTCAVRDHRGAHPE